MIGFISKIWKRTVFKTGTFCVNSDSLFSLYKRRKSVSHRVVSADTDLCVEGFQRSGNSYLFMCLSFSNPQLKIAHHIHGLAQVRLSIRKGVPCVVLLREPAASVASLVTWDERLGIDAALSAYINYYKNLIDLAERVVLIDFSLLIDDVDSAFKIINARYPLSLEMLGLSEEELVARMKLRQVKYTNKRSAPFPSSAKRIRNTKNTELVKKHDSFSEAKRLYQILLEMTS